MRRPRLRQLLVAATASCVLLLIWWTATFTTRKQYTAAINTGSKYQHRNASGAPCREEEGAKQQQQQQQHASVPALLHQTWKTDVVPAELQPFVKSWRTHNPGWRYMFWNDSAALALVKRDYAWFAPTFERFPMGVERADILRCMRLPGRPPPRCLATCVRSTACA
eukprot:COSAG01_NODE_3955_length_5495_cov_215.437280_1_plen_166_part_00